MEAQAQNSKKIQTSSPRNTQPFAYALAFQLIKYFKR
jgi:hypothetical protein